MKLWLNLAAAILLSSGSLGAHPDQASAGEDRNALKTARRDVLKAKISEIGERRAVVSSMQAFVEEVGLFDWWIYGRVDKGGVSPEAARLKDEIRDRIDLKQTLLDELSAENVNTFGPWVRTPPEEYTRTLERLQEQIELLSAEYGSLETLLDGAVQLQAGTELLDGALWSRQAETFEKMLQDLLACPTDSSFTEIPDRPGQPVGKEKLKATRHPAKENHASRPGGKNE